MPPVGVEMGGSKLNRKELEDEVLRLSEANRGLKTELNSKNDKIKQLAGKLIKALSGKSGGEIGQDEQEHRMAELESQNAMLKSKLQTAKHQLSSLSRMPLAPGVGSARYGHSRPRSSLAPTPAPPPAQPHQITVVHSQSSNQRVAELEGRVRDLEREKARLQREVDSLPTAAPVSALEQRAIVRENVETIRLQRQLREKSTELAQAQLKATSLETDLRRLKGSQDSVLVEMEALSSQLRSQQNRAATLEAQLGAEARSIDAGARGSLEAESLRRELESLRQANEELIANAFSTEREAGWAARERALEGRLRELEALVKADVATRSDILTQLARTTGDREKAESELHRHEAEKLKLQAAVERLQKRVDVLSTSGLAWSDSEGVFRSGPEQRPRFLESSPAVQFDEKEATERKVEKLELSLVETGRELEKTRNLLLAQYRINTEAQAELASLHAVMGEHKRRYEAHLGSYAAQLDQRGGRIQRLEAQLKDIASGKGRGFRAPSVAAKQPDPMDEQALAAKSELLGGENQVEVHLGRLALTKDATAAIGSATPNLFLTLEFFDFQIQFTPPVAGPTAELNFTCFYTVTVSDLFLHCLQTDGIVVELHESRGSRYRSWAGASIRLAHLLTASDGTIGGNVELQGLPDSASPGVHFGRLAFAVHFVVPLQRSLHLYRERVAALGYLRSNDPSEATESRRHQLTVSVHRCRGLSARHGEPPSAYVMYELWELVPHFTSVVHRSADPELNDAHTWALPASLELDHHLRVANVAFLVFDDAAKSDAESLIGLVRIPLLALAHGKPIQGTYAISNEKGEGELGWLDVSLSWLHDYIPPKGAMELQVPEPAIQLPKEESRVVEDLHREDELPEPVSVAGEQKPRPVVLPQALAVVAPVKTEERIVETQVEDAPVIRPLSGDRPAPPQLPSKMKTAEPQSPPPYTEVVRTPPLHIAAKEETPAVVEVDQPPQIEEDDDIEEVQLPPEPPRRQGSFTIAAKTTEQPAEEVGAEESSSGDSSVVVPVAKPRRVRITSEPEILGPKDSDEVGTSESEDDDLVLSSAGLPPSAIRTLSEAPDEESEVGIGIGKLTASAALCEIKDPLFVECIFYNEAGDVIETSALDPPKEVGETLNFDFVSHVAMNPKRFDLLYKMLLQNKEVKFILSTNPVDKGKCEDLATASMKIREIRDSGNNVLRKLVPLLGEDGKEFGKLEVTVKLLAALEVAADN